MGLYKDKKNMYILWNTYTNVNDYYNLECVFLSTFQILGH